MSYSPSAFARQGHRLPALAATAILILTCGVLAMGSTSAGAAPQTESIPLDSIDAAPTSGTLDNQVNWSVNVGTWSAAGQGYAAFPSDGSQVWAFDKPVSVAFGIAGLNNIGNDGQPECVILPVGTIAEEINEVHDWDPDTRTLCRTANTPAAESHFSHPGLTELEIVIHQGTGQGRGPTYIHVTYNVPVAAIDGPADGSTIPEGSTGDLAAVCSDGTGAVTAELTANGETLSAGTTLADLEPGDYDVEVTCTDEHGATDTATLSFAIAAGPVAQIDGPADGATIPTGSDQTLGVTCAGGEGDVTTNLTLNGEDFEPGGSLADLAAGTYEVMATCTDALGNTHVASSTFTVADDAPATTAPPTTQAPAELPRTGSDSTTSLGLIGGLTILAGIAVALAATRVYRPRHLR